MPAQPTLYLVRTDDHGDAVALEPAWTAPLDHPLAGDHRQLIAVPSRSGSHLIAFDAAGVGTVYDVSADDSAIVATNRSIDLAAAWDLVEPFQIGARNHLMAYSAERGQFGFFPLTGDHSLRKPYLFARARGGDATTGYTMTQPIVVNDLVYLMCYDFDTGRVVIYALQTTATGAPPLKASSVWVHQWAPKWTRFAFFRLGGGTFFLKTNVGRLNVNIDHVLDDPADGTIELGSHLELTDALELQLVRAFELEHATPWFVSYRADGHTTLNRFHPDCLGWTTTVSTNTVAGARHLVPFRHADRSHLLFC